MFHIDYSMLAPLVGGLIGFGLVHYFGKPDPPGKVKQRLIALGSFVIFYGLTAIGLQLFRGPMVPQAYIQDTVSNYAKLLTDNPKFVEATKGLSQEQISQYTKSLAQKGLRRLSRSDLIAWNKIRLEMAKQNKTLCAGLWTGENLNQEQVMSGLRKIKKVQVSNWYAISMKAASHEINQKPFTKADQAKVEEGFKFIRSNLDPVDQARFQKVLEQGVDANAEESCWGMQVMLTQANNMPIEIQEDFLKLLSTL